MSGGSYNYAYQSIDRISELAGVLEGMADDCRKFAVSEGKTWFPNDVSRELTLEERAGIVARALLLEAAAKKLRAAFESVSRLQEVMHDVEWVVSGDYGIAHLTGALVQV